MPLLARARSTATPPLALLDPYRVPRPQLSDRRISLHDFPHGDLTWLLRAPHTATSSA
jgi:hypothetical protein